MPSIFLKKNYSKNFWQKTIGILELYNDLLFNYHFNFHNFYKDCTFELQLKDTYVSSIVQHQNKKQWVYLLFDLFIVNLHKN